MPVYEVTDPETGLTLELTGDSPPTEQELEQLFAQYAPTQENAEPSDQEAGLAPSGRASVGGYGRTARAKKAAAQRREDQEAFLSSLTPEQRSLVESVGPLEAFAIGAGRGFTTIGRAIGVADPEDEAVTQSYENLEKAQPSANVGEVVGQSAPFVLPGMGVAGIASTPLRTVATGALGALEGGLIARGEGRNFADQLISAGVAGTVASALDLGLPVLGRVVGKAFRRLTGNAPKGALVDAKGNPSKELLKALEDNGLSFEDMLDETVGSLKGQVLDADQVARKAAFEAQGLTPTKAQVTRRAADFQAQQEAAKTSTKTRSALEAQEAILSDNFDNAVKGTAGVIGDTNTAIDTIVGRSTKLDSEISRLYKAARESAPTDKAVKLNSLTNKLKALAKSDRATGGAIDSTMGDLQARGVVDESYKVIGRIDVDTAEEVRKGINALFDPTNPFRNAKLRELKDALDDDVFRVAGKDVFQQARKAKAQFEQGLVRAKVSKFDTRSANLVRDILENRVSPDDFANDVVFSKRWRGEDIGQLKNYLLQDEAGTAAFNDLRAEVLQSIKDKAFIGPIDAEGFQALSRDKLEKAIAKIGRAKMEVLFTPDERKFLKAMTTIAELREPVRGTALGQGPSAQAVGKLRAELRQNSLLANVVDSISFDSKGRAAVRARPEKVINPIKGSTGRQAIALGAGAATSTQLAADE